MAVNNALNNSSTVFTVDNLNLDGNTLSSLSGNINLVAAASQLIEAQADGFILGRSVDGFPLEAVLENTSNTAGSDILLNIQSAGSSGGDAYLEVSIDGGQSYTMGLDNSASDAFVLSRGGTLGSSNVMSVNASTGAITLNSAYTLPTVDGTAGQSLQTDGAGVVTWQTDAGDITAVGDVTSGAAFTGTQGTTLTSTSSGFSLLAANNTSGAGGNVSLTGGATTNATSAGGSATLQGGAGNTSGNGGQTNVTGGTPGATGTGGAVTVYGGPGGGTSGAGGAIDIRGGSATGSGTGGAATIRGGNGVGASNGGSFTALSGNGGATGNGGSLTIQGGSGGATSGNGGILAITGGNATAGTSTGGDISITGGNGVAGTGGAGGAVSVRAGTSGLDTAGSSASLTGGTGNGTGAGGNARVIGGTSGATGAGGGITITAANGGATSGNGGAVTITSGSGTTDGIPGAINFTGGTAVGTNKNSAALTITAPKGTGIGLVRQIFLQASASGTASGTSAHTSVNRLILNGSVTSLTSGAASTIATVTNASNSMAGGLLSYSIECSDGTDFQVISGQIAFSLVNKATVVTSDILVLGGESSAASTGTLSAIFSFSGASLQVTPTTSLTATTLRITYSIMSNSQQSITVP